MRLALLVSLRPTGAAFGQAVLTRLDCFVFSARSQTCSMLSGIVLLLHICTLARKLNVAEYRMLPYASRIFAHMMLDATGCICSVDTCRTRYLLLGPFLIMYHRWDALCSVDVFRKGCSGSPWAFMDSFFALHVHS